MRKRFLELHGQFRKLLAAYRDSAGLAERKSLLQQMQNVVRETSGLVQKFSDDVEQHVLVLYSRASLLPRTTFKQANFLARHLPKKLRADYHREASTRLLNPRRTSEPEHHRGLARR